MYEQKPVITLYSIPLKVDIEAVLRGIADPEITEHSRRFFKTAKGEYGEGDQFPEDKRQHFLN